MLKEKEIAPDFSLLDKDGNLVKLSDFVGEKIVLYFYPKDNTPGCTRQACAFRNSYDEFKKRNVVVVGISKDSQKSHQGFASKHELPFILLSDPDLKVIKEYGVWAEKKLYGKLAFGVVRSTFVIDEKGIIEKVFPKANPDTNALDILKYLDRTN